MAGPCPPDSSRDVAIRNLTHVPPIPSIESLTSTVRQYTSTIIREMKRGIMTSQLATAVILANLVVVPMAWAQVTPSPSSAPGFVNTLMPQPSQLSQDEGRLVITPSFHT